MTGAGIKWIAQSDAEAVHEANFLRLDSSRIKSVLGWRPVWNIETAIHKTADWSKAYADNEDMEKITNVQIREYYRMQ